MISHTAQIEQRPGKHAVHPRVLRPLGRSLAAGSLLLLAVLPACLATQRDRAAAPADNAAVEHEYTQAYNSAETPPADLADASWPQQPSTGRSSTPQTQPAAESAQAEKAEIQRATSPDPAVTIRLDGQDFLTLGRATLFDQDSPIACRIVPEQPASRPDSVNIIAFKLIPEDPRQPVCRCEVQQLEGETALRLFWPGKAARLLLSADTLSPMLPVCLSPRDPGRIINAAMGQLSGDWFDGLFAPDRDWAVSLEGRVHCQELTDRVRLTFSTAMRGEEPATFIFRSHPDYLRTQHKLPGYAPLNRRRLELMPAAWMPLESGKTPGPDEIARNTVWMAINLQPYGAASVLLPGMQGMLPAVRSAAVPSAPAAGGPTPGARAPSASSPGLSPWECFQQMAAGITERFWGRGLTAQSMSSTLFVGEPLTLEQARLYASLIGLAGESPIACERMYALPAERIQLLRSIIPAAAVRAVDLFAHPALPPVWNLSVANGAGEWNVLGLFNTSDEARIESIELADLHLGTGAEQFAVYDLWEQRLLRIVRDRFQVRVSATGCRVVSIVRLDEDRPTIIATNRHITGGGVDLHDVRWDKEGLTLSGSSDLVGNDPYELLLYLPEGAESLELGTVQAPDTDVRCRAHGPLRVVTFERPTSTALNWKAGFYRSAQPPQSSPPRPRNLAARQNTRGVLLSWYQPDDRVVAHRIYRNQRLLAEVDGCEYQDSTASYNAEYEYQAAAVNFCGQESSLSNPLVHITPVPASTNLTQLVPLSVSQDRLPLNKDKSASGTPMRIGGQRIYRGIGTKAPSRMVYFIGGGYETFSGAVGIDDSARGQGSAIFRIIADGHTLFTSPIMRGGEPPLSFSVPLGGRIQLELVVADAGDGNEFDFADWANPYLRAAQHTPRALRTVESDGAGLSDFEPDDQAPSAEPLDQQSSIPYEN